jgi:surfeit locus 1 family protein
MARARLRPAFWPTVISIPAFLILLGLGFWQLERLHWKEGLIAAREVAIAAPPTEVPRSAAEVATMAFRHVRATGEFLNDREFLLGASNEAGTTGYHVITPLRLADGKLLLVDRGWIPGNLKDPAKRREGELAGTVTVEGLLRLGRTERPNWFVPENRCDINYWFWIDIADMARCGGLQDVLPFTVDAGPAPNPGGYPRGGVTRVALPNDHLQYAVTWFALAFGLATIYLLYHRQRRASPETSDGVQR